MDYSPLVQEHFARPRNVGQFSPGHDVIASSAGSASEGARIELSARIENERIRELRHHVYGCPHTIAAASWLTERLVGARRAELGQWRWREAGEMLLVPAEKNGRLLILEDAVHRLAKAWEITP
jgi:NifU-like protein involved in Fe-S cluster formation